ncbi:MAG: amidohydrolase family protein, partial [Cyanobacteria bacterium J06628_3]
IELSDKYNLCRHSHLLETKAQEKLAQEKYGCTAVEHLNKIGYLNNRTSLAHCVHLTDSDINILAETQSTVVHNPLSNLRLGSGIAPILKYRQAGVNVPLRCLSIIFFRMSWDNSLLRFLLSMFSVVHTFPPNSRVTTCLPLNRQTD